MKYDNTLAFAKWSQLNSTLAKNRRKKERITWSKVNERISNMQFRQMFRMTRDCFQMLCQEIESIVGEREFKAESYINAHLEGLDHMYMANKMTSGGYISGEIKLAIALRILAGADALDLSVIFDISSNYITTISLFVLDQWIIKTGIGNIDIVKYFNTIHYTILECFQME